MNESKRGPDCLPAERPRGLFLSGEGLENLTAERLDMLRQMLGSLGLDITVMPHESEIRNVEPPNIAPIPAARQDFRNFASDTSYSDSRACRAWKSLWEVNGWHKALGVNDPYPKIRFVRADEVRLGIVDLRSVYERFAVSKMSAQAWPSTRNIPFLVAVTNEIVRPEPPLQYEPGSQRRSG